MRQFIALQVLTGIVKKPEISQYWSTNLFLRSPIFNEVMPRNRFQPNSFILMAMENMISMTQQEIGFIK